MSLLTGEFPDAFKTSHIMPLLKKPNLDCNELRNYRPIANLQFVSKVLERVAASQLKYYIQDNDLFSPMQSAYRQFHSTETALLRVSNDMLLALDQGKEAVLVLLDYSAAFDTIDHGILFQRLRSRYGITGTALQWIRSYLSNRRQAVLIEDTLSDTFPLPWGVPQGSVKGPLDFILYTGPLSDVINAHADINHMIFADDSQIYVILQPNQHSVPASKLEACVSDIRTFAISNKLMLNDAKTEVIHITSKFRKSDVFP